MRMRIGGLQKVTLLDYPGKVACTVFLPGCNLRCPFCHNPTLVLPDRATGGLSTEKLLAFLETRRGKLDGVCVTGGEPTLYEDLPALLRQIRALGFAGAEETAVGATRHLNVSRTHAAPPAVSEPTGTIRFESELDEENEAAPAAAANPTDPLDIRTAGPEAARTARSLRVNRRAPAANADAVFVR